MSKYVKPIAVVNSNLAEGVYAASGDCYTVSANITQTPAEGRSYYVIHIDGSHAATDGHHSTQQMLTLTFNQPVTYVGSNGTLAGGDGTNSINILYSYHNNAGDNIGLGDVNVSSADGLAITGVVLSCNHECAQHK